jgi:hypothetical protein
MQTKNSILAFELQFSDFPLSTEVQNLPKNQKFPPPRKNFPKISPSCFFEENPVFIFQL